MTANEFFLSILIPAHNEAESIERMLNSVFRNTLWKETPRERREFIVCANGCTDRTAEIVKEIARTHPEVRVIEIQEKSKARAWNVLKRAANKKARTLFFADADVIVHWKALQELRKEIGQRKEIEAVSAQSIPTQGGEKSAFMRKLNRIVINASKQMKPNFNGSLYAIRRQTAEGINMPSNLILEDGYLAAILGPKARVLTKAHVYYRLPGTLHDLLAYRTRIRAGVKQLQAWKILQPESKTKFMQAKAREWLKIPLADKWLRAINFGLTAIARVRAGPKTKWEKIKSSKIGKRPKPVRKK